MFSRRLCTGSASSFICLLALWVTLTFASSVAGSLYIKSTLDCLTPALFAQAAAALFCSIRNGLKAHKQDSAAESLHPGWVWALGLLHLLSSVLTLASFGLSSVSDTYIIRTLEPIMSCCLLYVLHGQRHSLTDVLLLTVVAGATACVVLVGDTPGATLVVNSLLPASGSEQQLEAPKLTGSHMPVMLALVATLTVSCRSVASKTVAGWTGTSEYDTFLQSSMPGLVAAAFLQGGLWALSVLQTPHSSSSSSWSSAVVVSLVICALSQCAYSAASFKVLQQCSPVVHSMLNVLKRVFIITACALLLGRPLTLLQLLGIALANAAAAAFVVHQARRGTHSSEGLSLAAAGKEFGLGNCSGDRIRVSYTGQGRVQAAPSQYRQHARRRLVAIVGVTMLLGAVLLGRVLSVLSAHLAAQQQQQAVLPAQSHLWVDLSQVDAQLTLLSQQQQQQQWQDLHPTAPAAMANMQLDPAAAAAAAMASMQLVNSWTASSTTGLLNHNRNTTGFLAQNSSTNSSSSSTAVVPPHVQDYIMRDFGRIQCLTALHKTSKALLAPFLHNRTSGGIALFDVALHKNLGDAVLWAAAARLVPSFHDSVKYVCAQTQWPGPSKSLLAKEARRLFPHCDVKVMMQAIGPEGLVLLAPGGNWGDLWWFVHGQRLQYLADMAAAFTAAGSSVQVVQLPQSLDFNTPERAQQDQQVVNALPPGMLTLMTRTQASLDYATQHYPHTASLLSPDLAFSLGPLMPGKAQYDVLFLMRSDKEAAGSEAPFVPPGERYAAKHPNAVQPSVTQAKADTAGQAEAGTRPGPDGSLAAGSIGSEAQVGQALQQLQQLGLNYTIREWDFAHANLSKEVSKVALVQLAESRLQGAIDVISLGKVVVTNRLHAAIVANLLGRPLVWIDTRLKKLSSVRSVAFSYSSSCSEANMHSAQAASFSEAVKVAAGWLQSPDFIWSAEQVKLDDLQD